MRLLLISSVFAVGVWQASADTCDIQGRVTYEQAPDLRGMPKVRVDLIDFGLLYDTTCGTTTADQNGYFHIVCSPTFLRWDASQELRLYQRKLGECRKAVYKGTTYQGRVEPNGNYEVDELAMVHEDDDNMCPFDFYN